MRLASMKWQALVFLSIISILVGGCIGPTLATTLKTDRTILCLGEHANIECTVSNSTGNMTYEWSCSGGSIEGEGAVVDWFAPDSAGAYTIKVKAEEENGKSGRASLTINVIENSRPVIEDVVVTAEHKYLKKTAEGTAYSYLVGKAQEYHIECQAQDEDKDSLTYEWFCSAGEIQGSGPGVTWVAPSPSGQLDVEITVTVSDGEGGMATQELSLRVVACSACTFR